MFYQLLKPLMRLAIWLYFGKVNREGLEHIDNGRPSLIVANHTASFMDAIITAVYVRRRIWFFTRGDVFRYRVVAWLLRGLGMLPVYRMRDGKERLHENAASNDAALRILARGGAVLIFAEGESRIEKVLKPLKKGPFRLAVRAADSLAEPPLIVPLGINYVRPTTAFGAAWIVAGQPFNIPAGDFASSTRRATELMRQSAVALESLCWHLEYPMLRPVAQHLLEHMDEIRPGAAFRDTVAMTSTFNMLNQRSAEALLRDWDEFRIWQRYSPLPANLFRRAGNLREYLIVLLGAVLCLPGLLILMPAVTIPLATTRNRVKEPDFIAPVFLCISVLFHLTWLGFFGFVYVVNGFPPRMLALMLLMPLSQIFFLKIWLPAFRHVSATYVRAAYRRRNPSHKLVFRLHEVLKQIGWMMMQERES